MRRVAVWIGGLAALAVSVLLERVFHDPAHADLVWHTIPAFDLVFGVAGCALIVLLSKWLGHQYLQRPEDFYERERDP